MRKRKIIPAKETPKPIDTNTEQFQFFPMVFMGHNGYKAIYCLPEDSQGKGEPCLMPSYAIPKESLVKLISQRKMQFANNELIIEPSEKPLISKRTLSSKHIKAMQEGRKRNKYARR